MKCSLPFILCSTFSLLMAVAMAADAVPRRCLELKAGPDNPRNSECGFLPLKDGRILFMYTRFYGTSPEDEGAADLVARYSNDQGETWTQQDRCIAKNDAGLNIMEASLLRLQDGRIALFYNRKESETDCRPVMRISTDEGETWSDWRYCVTEPVSYFVLNNDRVIQTRSGRILLPLAHHARISNESNELDMHGEILCAMSDDGGETWRLSQHPFKAFLPPDNERFYAQEPGIVELKDGRLMMFIRSSAGCQLICHSSDDGESWTPPQRSPLIGPMAPASIKRLPNGDLLAVWNDHALIDQLYPSLRWRRVPLSTAISKDDGRTWENVKVLEGNPDGWYCYIAIQPLNDAVLLGYCSGGTDLENCRITKIPYAWLYQKEPAHPAKKPVPLYGSLQPGPFTRLESSVGVWTAAAGEAESFEYDDGRGKGVRLFGGLNKTMELELPKTTKLGDIDWLAIERYTSRSPYVLCIEAFKDGQWILVGGQDESTVNLKKHQIIFTKPELATNRLRFRCTSLLGAIVADRHDEKPISLNGFFND